MRIVAALGGNALLERSERPDAEVQEKHVHDAVGALVKVAMDHELVITHGNGPQVGLLAHESEDDRTLRRSYPFDVLVAQTQGMIGYWLLQSIENALPGRRVAVLLTQTLVGGDDPAFSDPQKFVGPVYDEETATRLAKERGWQVRPDGRAWRRVVPSPEPRGIVELCEIRTLLADGCLVVCAGGGGIPVVRGTCGLRGVEAVVDKDRTAALLAERLNATVLLILTDVDAVERDFGTPRASRIDRTTVSELRSLSFPSGSMGPKIDAACRFVGATGQKAVIGRLEDAQLLVVGKAGTVIEPG